MYTTNKPSTAKFKYNLDSELEVTRQLATSGGHEIIAIMVSAGGGAAAFRVSDSPSGVGPAADSILITANAGESSSFSPVQPIPMRRGIFVQMEQGAPGAEAIILYN